MSLPHSVAFIGLEVVFPAVFAVIGVGEDFKDENAAGSAFLPDAEMRELAGGGIGPTAVGGG